MAVELAKVSLWLHTVAVITISDVETRLLAQTLRILLTYRF